MHQRIGVSCLSLGYASHQRKRGNTEGSRVGDGKGVRIDYALTRIEDSRQHGLNTNISLTTENLLDKARRDNIDEFADRAHGRR